MKQGILVMAYGGPEKMEDIKPFYTDIRGGKVPSPELLEKLKNRYKAIGGSSPLLKITRKQVSALENALEGKIPCYLGMRHWHPSVPAALDKMRSQGIEEAVLLVMAPHFSRMSICKYFEKVNNFLGYKGYKLKTYPVEYWYDHPLFIGALADRVNEKLSEWGIENKNEVEIIFTAHSLPEKIKKWDDPYPEQLDKTCRLLAGKISHDRWQFAYQSAGRTSDPWLAPSLEEVIRELAGEGKRQVLVCPIGFISDHLEILYDIDIEARKLAESNGLRLGRIRSLNDDPLRSVVLQIS